MRIYWSSIEYEYKESKNNLLGGFVYVFIKTSDVKNALEIILKEFKAEKLIPHDIEFIKPYNAETEWENANRTKHYNKLYKSALKTSEIIFDDFYATKTKR